MILFYVQQRQKMSHENEKCGTYILLYVQQRQKIKTRITIKVNGDGKIDNLFYSVRINIAF
jgi:hypothetical protein